VPTTDVLLSDLTLRELEAAASALAAIFFPLLDTRVSRQQSRHPERCMERLIRLFECASDPVPHGPRLTNLATPRGCGINVENTELAGERERFKHYLLKRRAWQVLIDGPFVDGDSAFAGRQPHASDGIFTVSGCV